MENMDNTMSYIFQIHQDRRNHARNFKEGGGGFNTEVEKKASWACEATWCHSYFSIAVMEHQDHGKVQKGYELTVP